MRQSAEECLQLVWSRDKLKETDPERESRIYDVSYSKLVKDPIAVIKDIYKNFGYEFTPEFEENIRTYLENNPKGRHGKFEYSLSTFNLSNQDVEREFKEYEEKYSKYF